MKVLKRGTALVLFGLVLGIFLTLGQGVLAEKHDTGSLPLEDLRTFTEIFAKIKNDYVEAVKDKDLLENAIRGMLSGLDPHSAYLVPDDYKDLQAGTSGEFGGLGIEVGMEDGFVKVISPIDDTPAERAGVEAGDLVIRLDDTPVKGMSLADAVKVMRGKPGTDITLTIVREGEDRPLKITITRDVIRVTSVKSRTLEDGYGYVRISQFQTRTGENLRDSIAKLKEDSKGGLKGLVLDLRNNPGGVLSAAVSVSDAFLKKGIIVYTEGRMGEFPSSAGLGARPVSIQARSPPVEINGECRPQRCSLGPILLQNIETLQQIQRLVQGEVPLGERRLGFFFGLVFAGIFVRSLVISGILVFQVAGEIRFLYPGVAGLLRRIDTHLIEHDIRDDALGLNGGPGGREIPGSGEF